MDFDEYFFSRRALHSPDGRPLHAYDCGDEEFDHLSQLLKIRIASGQTLPSTARWFVFWAAEFIRKDYRQGSLSWDLVFQGLGLSGDHGYGRALVEQGLKQWGRQVRRRDTDAKRLFLYSLMAEGGLPDAFLTRHSGYADAVLLTVSELLRHSVSDREMALPVARRRITALPAVYQDEEAVEMLCDLALALAILRRALPENLDDNAIEIWLERNRPGWAHQLPIRLSEEARRTILRPALSERIHRTAAIGQMVRRFLRRSVDGTAWVGTAEVTDGGLLPKALLPNVEQRLVLRLTSDAGMILRAGPDETGWRLRRAARDFVALSPSEPLAFAVSADGHALGDVVLDPGSPLPDEAPSFWRADNGHTDRLAPLHGPRTKNDSIWALLPAEYAPQVSASARIHESAPGPNGVLWQFSGQGEVACGHHRFSIATGSDADATEVQLIPFGTPFPEWRAVSGVTIYRGEPYFLAAEAESPLHDVTRQVTASEIPKLLGGRIYRWTSGGVPRASVRCVVVPQDVSLHAQEIAPGHVRLMATGVPPTWQIILEAANSVVHGHRDGERVVAELKDVAGTPSALQVRLFETQSGASLGLERSWPARDPMLVAPDGARMTRNHQVALGSISGWRGVLPAKGGAVLLRIAEGSPIGFPASGTIRLATYRDLLAQAVALSGADGKVNLRLAQAGQSDRLEISRYDWSPERVAGEPDLGSDPVALSAMTVSMPILTRQTEASGPFNLASWLSDVGTVWFVQGHSAHGVMRPLAWTGDGPTERKREARIASYCAAFNDLLEHPDAPGWQEFLDLVRAGRNAGDCGALDQVQSLGRSERFAATLLMRHPDPLEILDLETEAPLWWPLIKVRDWQFAISHTFAHIARNLMSAGLKPQEANETALGAVRKRLWRILQLRPELGGHFAAALKVAGYVPFLSDQNGERVDLAVKRPADMLLVFGGQLASRSPMLPQGGGSKRPTRLVPPLEFADELRPLLEAPLRVAEVAAGIAPKPNGPEILELLALRFADPEWFALALPLAVQLAVQAQD
ncbi:MAG: STY4851/ECs_5259 family protein [Maritimibacter sp.]|nr:STY4851/ECs_5259 family protein [Maritimibacter sp.]